MIALEHHWNFSVSIQNCTKFDRCELCDSLAKKLTIVSLHKKGKGSFYIAQYPVGWTAQSVVHFLPPLAALFIPTRTRLLRVFLLYFFIHQCIIFFKLVVYILLGVNFFGKSRTPTEPLMRALVGKRLMTHQPKTENLRKILSDLSQCGSLLLNQKDVADDDDLTVGPWW